MGMAYEDPKGGRRRAAHYTLQTVATSAPEFANQEQDTIRQSFSTGNHTWMKQALPVELAPDSVNQLRRQRMERNRLAEPLPQTWSKMTQLWGGGCYHEFEYIPDEYERRSNFSRGLRQISNEKRDAISNHDWRYASQEKRLRHESMINDPRNKECYPYLGGDKESELGQHSGLLRGGSSGGPAENMSFLAGKGRGLEDDSKNSRMSLPTIVMRLQKRLDEDWEGCTVVVSATEQDLVQIAFNMGTVDSERGVAAYMNVLSKDPEVLGAFGLRKVSQLWGMRRDFSAAVEDEGDGQDEEETMKHTWIFYILTPKWVRMRPTDAFYTTHPRSQGSAFRMSAAGSSVLLSLGSTGPDPSESSTRKRATPLTARGRALDTAGSDRSGQLSSRGEDRVQLGLIERAISGLPALRDAARQ
eukprot:TRINITY_DN81911_c0_g1_i1.p1 TRINITY_DN81911_c0_g1~~TRINITY_DN81911_c0_g1_i1.p1  ORF type:complete len:415 (-),score=90.25 TRINITY_DN81911_c0_g1_i1:33-1277(-)